jgi:hypothetical protein
MQKLTKFNQKTDVGSYFSQRNLLNEAKFSKTSGCRLTHFSLAYAARRTNSYTLWYSALLEGTRDILNPQKFFEQTYY